MGIKRYRPKVKSSGLHNSRGETLVETIVSFMILLLAIGAMTTMIVTANNMNKKAQERSHQIENEAIAAENGDVSDVVRSNGSMTITVDGQRVIVPLKVKKSGDFVFFGAA